MIIRASNEVELDYNYTGMDEENVIMKMCEIEDFHCVGDLNMGLGLVALGAFRAGKNFVGTEINPRRLANALQKVSKENKKIKGKNLLIKEYKK